MPLKIQKLDHFSIYVTDLSQAENFYSKILGMEVHNRIGVEQLLMKCGETLLALFAKPDLKTPVEPGAPDNPFGRVHFALRISFEDWEKARLEFEEVGIPLSHTIDWGDHKCFYITDPDGNLIELMSS